MQRGASGRKREGLCPTGGSGPADVGGGDRPGARRARRVGVAAGRGCEDDAFLLDIHMDPVTRQVFRRGQIRESPVFR